MGFPGHRAAETTRSGISRPKPNSPILSAANTLANSGYRLQKDFTTSPSLSPSTSWEAGSKRSLWLRLQFLPRLQVNHCQGPARERIQLRCHSASCVFGPLLWTLRAMVVLSGEAIALCVSDLIKPVWRVHLQVTDGVGLCHPIKYPLGNQPVLPWQELNLSLSPC